MTDNLNEFGQKQAFSFDEVTGEFKSIVWADPDQLNEGEFLLPANATFNKLDDAEEGFVAVYKEGIRQDLIDNRGIVYWDNDGEKYSITEIGVAVPEWALFDQPTIPLTQDEQITLANIECTKRINFKWNQVGQINASLGIYGEEDKTACANWISVNRDALSLLLDRSDLTEIDVTDDEFWPALN